MGDCRHASFSDGGNTVCICWCIALRLLYVDWEKNAYSGASKKCTFCGFILLTIGLLLGEYPLFDYQKLGVRALWSLGYLIIFGSIMAFTAFNFLLKNVSPTKIVTSTYINPVVALILGYYLNKEGISWQSLLAAGLLIVGVVLINWRKKGAH